MGAKIMLDSGAFTAWTKGIHIDIDKYIQFVKDHSYLFDICINLDVIGDPEGSWKNWKYMKDSGVLAMPVYHNGAPEKYLKRYMRYTDYIGFGAIAKLSTKQRILGLRRIWDTYLQDDKGTPLKKVHGLGLAAVKIMYNFPWYSVDSASCVKAASFGKIYLPVRGDFRNIDSFTVSDQGRHEGGSNNSFFSCPITIQKQWIELIERNGFTLGRIKGRVLRPRRCRKGEERNSGPSLNLDLGEEPEDSIPTLCNSCIERYKFNLKIWEQVAALPSNSIDVYHVCSTPKHLRIVSEVCEVPKVLISYLVMSDPMMEEIRRLKGASNENQKRGTADGVRNRKARIGKQGNH